MTEQIDSVVSCVKQEKIDVDTQESTDKNRKKVKHTPVLYRVRFNTGLEVCFSADEVYEYHFYEEAELRHSFQTIMTRILFRRLLTGVLPYVVFTKRTEFQVRQRAEQISPGDESIWVQYQVDAVDMLLDYLRTEQYVNDAHYAEVFVRNQANKGVSRNAMMMELSKRGISRELAEQTVCAANPDELESAKSLLFKKLCTMHVKPGDSLSMKEKGKLYRFLSGKGFRADTIRAAMSAWQIDEDGDDIDANTEL